MKNYKYTIGDVQQQKLLELDLDIKDAFILTYIRDLAGADSIISKVVDGESYYWIDYQKMVDYMPILAIGNIKVIGRRITTYQNLGLVKRHLHKNFNQTSGRASNNYTFITITPKFKELFEISKVKIDKSEVEEKAREMGLSTEGTQKFSRVSPGALKSTYIRGHSKVPTLEGTQKCPLNTPNNYTPIKNTTTKPEDNVKTTERQCHPGETEKSSSSSFEYLDSKEFNKITPKTKKNIIDLDIPEAKVRTVYKIVIDLAKQGKVKDFNAYLYSSLKDNWHNDSPLATKKINNIETIKIVANMVLADAEQDNWDFEKVKFEFLERTKNFDEDLIKIYLEKIKNYFNR